MNYHIQPHTGYSVAHIIEPKCRVAKAVITVDIHHANSITEQSVQTIMADALLSGAGTHSRDEFLEAVNLLGASIDISINNGRCTITLRATATVFPKLLQLFALMITQPTFSATELKRIKATSINQLHQAKEDSKSIAHEQLQNIFYGSADRKYSYSIDETIAEISTLKRTQLVKLHAQLLSHPWFVTAGGSKESMATLSASIEKIKKPIKTVAADPTHQPLPPTPILSLEHIPSRQNIDFSIGLPLPITNQHPDFIPLTYAVAILGKWGGFTGRLMSTVREKEGLTYGIYGQLEGFVNDEQGNLRIMTFFPPQKAILGLTSTFREITKLYQSGVTSSEVAKFKVILGTQQTMLNDSLSRQLGDLHSYHFQGYTVTQMEAQKALLEKVSIADINRVIKTYLDPTLFSVSAAGPVQDLRKALRNWHQSV